MVCSLLKNMSTSQLNPAHGPRQKRCAQALYGEQLEAKHDIPKSHAPAPDVYACCTSILSGQFIVKTCNVSLIRIFRRSWS